MEKGIGREDCTGTMIVKEEWEGEEEYK